MNVELAVLNNLRKLPSKNQEEVLTYIKTLQEKLKAEPLVKEALWQQFATQFLYNLQCMQRLHDGFPSAVYADSLFQIMQQMFGYAPGDPITGVLMVLHDAMVFQNRWINYTPEQYQAAYTLFEEIFNRSSLIFEDFGESIQRLERLGFVIMPYETLVNVDEDLDDD